jgi:hypothetical protein
MMDCLNPIAPSGEELIGFALDGKPLSEEARSHLAECETCKQRLDRYKQVNAFLVGRLYRSQCPTVAQLSLYCVSFVPVEERTRIANHILDCPLCASEVADTRRFLLQEQEQDQRQDAELPAISLVPRALVRRVFAIRLGNLHPQMGMRKEESAETAWPRQYKAESIDLFLHLSYTSSGERRLIGILTSTNPSENAEALEGVPARLYAAPGPVSPGSDAATANPLSHAQVDDLGSLVFKSVSIGEYVIVLYLPERELVIDGLIIE